MNGPRISPETITNLKTKEDENRKKADLIYEKYQLIDTLLNELRKAVEKHSWEEIQKKLKGHKIIKKVNSKEKTIEIEI